MLKNVKFKILIFLGLLVFTRFYNLDTTARFTEDESKDLVGIHQSFVDKKLTLVGPTNVQGTKVFSSLTFYMLLPGAILGNFDPVSPAYSATFWGLLTAILIVIYVKNKNSKFIYLIGALTLFWFPLLQTSRWAWNPNLIPFWIVLAILLLTGKSRWFKFLAGVCLGLSIHAHYYSIFAVGLFVLLVSINYTRKREIKEMILLWAGVMLMVLPFVIFDLRHPPGIFIPNLFSQSQAISGSANFNNLFLKSISNFKDLMLHYTQSTILAIVLSLLVFVLLVYDILRKSPNLIFFLPWLFQISGVAVIPQFFPHYLIPGLIFFLVWIISKRKEGGEFISYSILIILLIGGIFSVNKQLTSPTSIPAIPTLREINSIIKNEIKSKDLKNVNMAVLASPDLNTEGKRYRDILLVSDNIHILSNNEYQFSDHLFVVSTSSELIVRKDPSYEMHRFRSGPLVNSWKIENGWFIYHFTRGI